MGVYWYKTFIRYCPVCGHEEKYKERQYSPRPEDPAKTWDLMEEYDWCLEWEGIYG